MKINLALSVSRGLDPCPMAHLVLPRLGASDPEVSVSLPAVQQIVADLGLSTTLTRAALPVMLRQLHLMELKQRAYGEHNLTRFGPMGVVVRATDKMERLANLTGKMLRGEDVAKSSHDEALTDTFRDLANYGIIGALMQSGLWPEKRD